MRARAAERAPRARSSPCPDFRPHHAPDPRQELVGQRARDLSDAAIAHRPTVHLHARPDLARRAREEQLVRIGQLLFGMNYRHPAVLAKALAPIDHLSDGRLEIGLGAGWHEAEYRAYGIPFPAIGERLDILEEGIQVVRMLMTMERATYVGDHFTLTDATCEPKPLQANPRIWVGGNGEKRTLRIVARH